MLTIFSITRPFYGHFNIIQRNAISSWVRLQPCPEIILIGNEFGQQQVAKEFGLRHHLQVARDKFGFAYMKDIIKIGSDLAGYPLICYVNADIILLNDFIQSIRNIQSKFGCDRFFIGGRRYNLDVDNLIDYDAPDYQIKLKESIKSRAGLARYSAIDYFVFPKSIVNQITREMPPFVVGVTPWDNWFLYMIRRMHIPFIDATSEITAVHQNHESLRPENIGDDIHRHGFRLDPYEKRLYSLDKRKLCSFRSKLYSLYDATHILDRGGVKKASNKRKLLALRARMISGIWYIFTDIFYPYSQPLTCLIKKIADRFQQ